MGLNVVPEVVLVVIEFPTLVLASIALMLVNMSFLLIFDFLPPNKLNELSLSASGYALD